MLLDIMAHVVLWGWCNDDHGRRKNYTST